MNIPDDLQCLFNADVREQGDSYVLEVPKQEVEIGAVRPDHVYRVALFPSDIETRTETDEDTDPRQTQPDPPVSEGDTREVDIENIGEQGDGIARVERGYVIIVPGTETGERVTIEITDVQKNVAFAEVVDRHTHF